MWWVPGGTTARLEAGLEKAQRARKKARVRALHAKIKNSRKDQFHKLSTVIIEEYSAIFISNVNALALAKTRMAKPVLDEGWSLFRTMPQYK
jgi:putative transposase